MNPQQPMPSRRRWWAAAGAAAAIAAAGGAVFGLQTSHAESPNPQAAPPAVPVSVAAVLQQEIALWDEFSGRLEAVQRVDIRPRVGGAVQAVHFREGSLVKQGDLLVTVDPAPYAAEVDRAEAQVVAAQARVSYTRSEMERATRLWEERAIAQREHDERVNAQREADANLRAAQAALQTARLNLGYTQVRAPVSGRVGRIEVTVGNLVAAGAGAPILTTLVSVSPIYASFDTDEQIVAKALEGLRSGKSARTLIESIPVQMGTGTAGGTPHTGHLQLIDNQVDARSGTVRVRAVFDNADGVLMPGQFARIRMGQVKNTQAVLINERAVGTDQNKKYVMVVGEGNKAEYREVQLGAPVNGLRVVTSGLKAGERIVVNGLQRVRPGAQVAPQDVPMTAKAELGGEAAQQARTAAKQPAA
ncbi:efflux RND transporter periplasmic adaptor subunit [Paracidovorax valerianellae]|uniref:Membrane fusion protein, multidrug efflux system n=1 Tax=Paracidovorax valerianellae TaxID=187868 RepID=A0A1G6WR38_9BURK|nr:efflux RND transporter periplasmic adaptor subunit [Paracidovorax valerianellae]MDA8447623.1 efflux RND transporter periplasmic adaptor subunit [Paracidovorax valerianellae]SDD68328.1 membrane fusion protein, multidrug efflux system [Paracidovorax valerianellae]